MRLYGFQCDNCQVKSKDKPGFWHEVTTMNVKQDSWTNISAFTSDGLHYCSRECLKEAIDKWPKR